ncbi:MAG: hypothetical protein ACRESR_07295, partial [Gammaproteobacteria bacterium]
PNVHASPGALQKNVDFALALEAEINRNAHLLASTHAAEKTASANHDKARADKIETTLKQLQLARINGRLLGLLRSVSSSDKAPTPTVSAAAAKLRAASQQAHDAISALLVPDR